MARDSLPATHYLIDGGKLFVNDPDQFLQDYVTDITNNKYLCVVEIKTEPFKFFVDFDIHDSIDSVTVVKIARTLNAIIGAHRCFVARRPEYTNITGPLRSGVHFHWPDQIVTQKKALYLHSIIRDHIPEYANSFDKSVYSKGMGLRMIWSYKHSNTSKPYVPWAMITATKELHLPTEPAVDILKMFSIRCFVDSEDKDEEETSTKSDIGKTPLETFIRNKIPGQSGARITNLKEYEKSIAVGTDSKWCQNIKREHKGNHIWFKITGNVIRQMCHDMDCKGFEGDSYVLPPSARPNVKDFTFINTK